MVDLATKSLLHDRVRFAITVSGVAFAVTLILVQVGLFIGILDNSTITIEKLGADLWITSKNSPNLDFVHHFRETRLDEVRAVSGVERADNLIVEFVTLRLPAGAEETMIVYAMRNFQAWGLPWKVTSGDLGDLRRGPHLFLDESARRRFGDFRVGEYREVQGQRLKIIGTTREARSFTTTPIGFMDLERAQGLAPEILRGNTSYIVVRVAPNADASVVRAEIQRRLPYNDVYIASAWAKRSRDYWIDNTGIGFNALLTVFLGCLVGVVIVAQTLYTSTMEHLQEFGTIKAIGGRNSDIYRILAKQATLAGVAGFILGYLPAQLLKPVVERADLKLIVPTELTLGTFIGTIVLCLAASVISFRKVASIDPSLVFRN
jgi:putative ABC transport system permease protein